LGSLNIGLNGSFASWVGELIPDIKQPILLVVGEGKETEAITRLARIGYDNCLGYLEGGMEIWEKANKAIQQIQRFDPEELRKMNASSRIIDVRKQSEFESQHIVGAENYPLNRLQEQLKDLPKETFLFLICAGGYRSMIAASILAANGFKNIGDIRGGMTEALKQKVPVTSYVCPNTML
jgi:rhodanese-related sulfurtransferase